MVPETRCLSCNDKRPQLLQMLDDAESGKFDYVLVVRLDRLYRNLMLLLNTLNYLRDLGVSFISTSQNFDTSKSFGIFALQMMGSAAELERGLIGERVSECRQRLTREGIWAGGIELYGWKWNTKVRNWELTDHEAEVVRYIYRLYVVEKLGYMKITERLNAENYRTRRHKPFSTPAVRGILTNPAYKGEHHLGYKMNAIVDADIWDKAQERRKENRSERKVIKKDWLLQGVLICGYCGHKFLCTQKKKNHARKYSCYGTTKMAHLDGSPRCDCPSYDGEWLESTVWKAFLKTVNDPELLQGSVKVAIEVLKGQKESMAATDHLEAQLKKLKERKERLGLTYGDGCIERERYERELDLLRKQETVILKQLNNLDPEIRMKAHNLERLIRESSRLLGKGKIHISSFGMYGFPDDSNIIIGLGRNHPWRDSKLYDMEDAFNMVIPPVDFWQRNDVLKIIKRNQRTILQDFGIKVYCHKDKIEIRGFISPTTIQTSSDKVSVGAQDIKSGCRLT
ncbi:recombinase family protein [Chloroflexota bacterium]